MNLHLVFRSVAILINLCILAGCASLPLPGFLQKAKASVGAPVPAPQTPTAQPPIDAPPPKKKNLLQMLMFWRKERPPVAQPLAPSAQIYLVNEPGGFVVIEGYGVSRLPEGTMLGSIREGRIMATFRIAPERRPPFAVAEIVSGKATAGELLYQIR
jgi:hypothetical protein